MIPLTWYLISLGLYVCCGIMFAGMARRNAMAVLMGIELMLNAANINLIAFWRYGVAPMERVDGQVLRCLLLRWRQPKSRWVGAGHLDLSQPQTVNLDNSWTVEGWRKWIEGDFGCYAQAKADRHARATVRIPCTGLAITKIAEGNLLG